MPDRFKVTKTDAADIDATYHSILKDEEAASVLGKLLPTPTIVPAAESSLASSKKGMSPQTIFFSFHSFQLSFYNFLLIFFARLFSLRVDVYVFGECFFSVAPFWRDTFSTRILHTEKKACSSFGVSRTKKETRMKTCIMHIVFDVYKFGFCCQASNDKENKKGKEWKSVICMLFGMCLHIALTSTVCWTVFFSAFFRLSFDCLLSNRKSIVFGYVFE